MNKNRQSGITAIGLVIVLALIAFFTLLVLRLAPPYMEYFSVASSLKSLQQEAGIGSKSPHEIRVLLRKRLDINDVSHVTDKDITITHSGGMVHVKVAYEVRVPMLANVDAVVSFHDAVEAASH